MLIEQVLSVLVIKMAQLITAKPVGLAGNPAAGRATRRLKTKATDKRNTEKLMTKVLKTFQVTDDWLEECNQYQCSQGSV